MPVRATKRGAERTPLEQRDCDVLICGASFAGLAVARELAGSGAKVLVLDRYELGERQTSACAMPTLWLDALALGGSRAADASTRSSRTPPSAARAGRCRGRSRRSTTASCARCCGPSPERTGPTGRDGRTEFELEIATVTGRDGFTVHTDRGSLQAPLIVDALGWRRVLSNGVGGTDPAAERADVARPGGPPGRDRHGARAVDRPALHPLRLRLELPRAR